MKTFTMWAVPYNNADLNGTLDVETAGAIALFAIEDEADEYNKIGCLPGTRPVKVRVTIERSGKRRKAK